MKKPNLTVQILNFNVVILLGDDIVGWGRFSDSYYMHIYLEKKIRKLKDSYNNICFKVANSPSID
jgi:hypothetical protein